jgi:carbon-monoxide dehydrogenase small subunit
VNVSLTVNGKRYQHDVEPRTLLVHHLRDTLGLTGTRVGCVHGVCGACTVLLDGTPARSCILLAAQVDGHSVTTIEGVGGPQGRMSPVQDAFCETHALQCGFCTSGMVLAVQYLLDRTPQPTLDDIDESVGGNICRCTGYVQIREAVQHAVNAAGRAAGTGATQPASNVSSGTS